MELEILEEKQNPLFNRKEILIELESEITPTNAEIEKMLMEKFKTQGENIKIKKIAGNFGSRAFTIRANIYSSKEEKEKTEIQKLKKGKEQAKPEEKKE